MALCTYEPFSTINPDLNEKSRCTSMTEKFIGPTHAAINSDLYKRC